MRGLNASARPVQLPAAVQAIIFDMDGVLIDSAAVHARAFREILGEVALEFGAYRDYAGRRTDDVIRTVAATAGLQLTDARIAELTEAKRQRANRYMREMPILIDGVSEALDVLGRRFRLALASSASRRNVDVFLERSGSASSFAFTLSGEDVVASKPSPEIYRDSVIRLGLLPQQCVVIEDAPAGIEAARSAGVQVVAVASTVSRETLEAMDVIGVIDHVSQLTKAP